MQADKQADNQIGRQQTDRQTIRQTNKQTDRQTYAQTSTKSPSRTALTREPSGTQAGVGEGHFLARGTVHAGVESGACVDLKTSDHVTTPRATPAVYFSDGSRSLPPPPPPSLPPRPPRRFHRANYMGQLSPLSEKWTKKKDVRRDRSRRRRSNRGWGWGGGGGGGEGAGSK